MLQKVIDCCVVFKTLPWRSEIRNIQCNVCAITSGGVVFQKVILSLVVEKKPIITWQKKS